MRELHVHPNQDAQAYEYHDRGGARAHVPGFRFRALGTRNRLEVRRCLHTVRARVQRYAPRVLGADAKQSITITRYTSYLPYAGGIFDTRYIVGHSDRRHAECSLQTVH